MGMSKATEVQIDRFLRREMTEEERKAFEKRIENEPDLVEEVLLRRDIMVGIKIAEHESLHKLMDGIARKVEQEQGLDEPNDPRKPPKTLYWILGGVAAVGVLILLYFLLT